MAIMGVMSTTFYLSAILIVCWALTVGLTWAPCYSQVCPERYHPLATRMHIVAYYGLLASLLFALLLRASGSRYRDFSQHHLTTHEVPILRKRITIGGLILAVWIVGVVLATSAFWAQPLLDYWTAKCAPIGWTKEVPQLLLTGIFAHHADILLGLLLIPVGKNSVLGRAFHLHQHTLLYAHKLLAYLTVISVVAHGVTFYTFVADWMAVPWTREGAEKKLALDLENPNIALTEVKQLGLYYTISLFTGTVCLALMLVIVLSSLPIMRRKAYNTFYYMHIIFSSLVFVGASIHSSTNFYFLLPGLFLWMVDWAWRLFGGDTGLTQKVDGTLEDAGNGWYRITLPPCVKNLPPGLFSDLDGKAADEEHMVAHPLQTYYLNLPSVSKLQSHALSAASVGSTTTGPTFILQPTSIEGKSRRKQERTMKKEWTWRVRNQAGRSEDVESAATRNIRVRAEGPYFPPDRDFETVDQIICVVGGTGVTGALSLAKWFLEHRMQESKASLIVIWTIHDASMAQLSEWQGLLAHSPGSGGKLRLRSHASSEYGRLNVDEAIRAELVGDNQTGHRSAWVYISGPAGLLTTAEDVCCDIEAELRAARKAKESSGFAVDAVSHFAVKWEV